MTKRRRDDILQCLDPFYDLVRLIERWLLHEEREQSGALGYPQKSSFLAEIRQQQASSIEPMGYCREDYNRIALAWKALSEADMQLFAAASMFYKPWRIEAFRMAGYPFAPDQTYYNRLVRAHQWLQSEMGKPVCNEKVLQNFSS